MDPAVFQKRLKDNFSAGNMIGPRLLPVMTAEQSHSVIVEKELHGHCVLAHAFLDFYAEALQLAAKPGPPSPPPTPDFPALYIEYLTMFRSFRAADVLFHAGYPLDGFALLRDVKDQAVLQAAIIAGLTTYGATQAHDEFSAPPPNTVKQRVLAARKKEEQRVFRLMLGRDSGLGSDAIGELSRWGAMFHYEVHGSRLTRHHDRTDAWKAGVVRLAPRYNVEACTMYENRFSEVAWMVLRCMTSLQRQPGAFGEGWIQRWDVLDDSFRILVEGLGGLGKEIGKVIPRLMSRKFAFAPRTTSAHGIAVDQQPEQG